MPTFETLFGQSENNIKKVCVLAPYMTKGLLKGFGIEKLYKGNPYSSANGFNFTFIHTQISTSFLGDVVLRLKNTPCEHLILFGSCGAVSKQKNIDFGSLVVPQCSYAFEGFSRLLEADVSNIKSFAANEQLLKSFGKLDCARGIPVVNCATFGSFYLEEKYKEYLESKKIDIIEMECSAFFHAARNVKKKAFALFYVTDILGEKNVFDELSESDKKVLELSIVKGQKIIHDFITSLNQL